MSKEGFYLPFQIEELSELICFLPDFHKCRVVGFLCIELKGYVIKSFSDLMSHSIKITFDGTCKVPPLTTPEPAQIFGEVVHTLCEGKRESFLRAVIIQCLQPSLLNPLNNIIMDIKAMELEEVYGFHME